MRKNAKLRLSRETLHRLQPQQAAGIRAGGTQPPLTNSQLPSYDPCDTQLDCTNGCVSDLCVSGVNCTLSCPC